MIIGSHERPARLPKPSLIAKVESVRQARRLDLLRAKAGEDKLAQGMPLIQAVLAGNIKGPNSAMQGFTTHLPSDEGAVRIEVEVSSYDRQAGSFHKMSLRVGETQERFIVERGLRPYTQADPSDADAHPGTVPAGAEMVADYLAIFNEIYSGNTVQPPAEDTQL